MPTARGTEPRPHAASKKDTSYAASYSTSRPGTRRARIAKPGKTPTANTATDRYEMHLWVVQPAAIRVYSQVHPEAQQAMQP